MIGASLFLRTAQGSTPDNAVKLRSTWQRQGRGRARQGVPHSVRAESAALAAGSGAVAEHPARPGAALRLTAIGTCTAHGVLHGDVPEKMKRTAYLHSFHLFRNIPDSGLNRSPPVHVLPRTARRTNPRRLAAARRLRKLLCSGYRGGADDHRALNLTD